MTRADYDTLRLALERNGGAHVHTANKATMYLHRLVDKPKAKFSNCSQDEFIAAVRAAVYQEKWTELGDLMSKWW